MLRGAVPLYPATWTESGVRAHGECEDVAFGCFRTEWRPWGFYPISCTNSYFAIPRRALGTPAFSLFTQHSLMDSELGPFSTGYLA